MSGFDAEDPITKKAIAIVCDAIKLDTLFLEVLFMNPLDDKDELMQCTKELVEKHDPMYCAKFIHAVDDIRLKDVIDHWISSEKLSIKDARAYLYEMLLGLQDFKEPD